MAVIEGRPGVGALSFRLARGGRGGADTEDDAEYMSGRQIPSCACEFTGGAGESPPRPSGRVAWGGVESVRGRRPFRCFSCPASWGMRCPGNPGREAVRALHAPLPGLLCRDDRVPWYRAGVARSYTTPVRGWQTIWRTLANPGEWSRAPEPVTSLNCAEKPGGLM
ncbi:hypothetical protein GCM10012280_57730 [Wenjunlia tyrosinilytica]|uniref:Uncharacterized protein n=1 Tax=Wenjunlia tyrosinilytica TaxID=1544741 RepID=A0A917ZW72_9ACTN|nr:hypothetical protein GCM10012280_57730 [Wenjunlia tyrosinilytica]